MHSGQHKSRLTGRWYSKRTFSFLGGTVAVTALALSAVATQASATGTGAQINGTGSSFAAPAILTWIDHVTTAPYNLNIAYSPSNSGTGRYEFTNQTTDWAVSDIGYVGNTDTTPPSFPFNFIPITAGGIAFMYNIPGLTKTVETRQLHCLCASDRAASPTGTTRTSLARIPA